MDKPTLDKYRDILKDNMYMLSQSFKKSEELLINLEIKNSTITEDDAKQQLYQLFSRMQVNINDFFERFKLAESQNEHQSDAIMKSKLSLIKHQNTEDTDDGLMARIGISALLEPKKQENIEDENEDSQDTVIDEYVDVREFGQDTTEKKPEDIPTSTSAIEIESSKSNGNTEDDPKKKLINMNDSDHTDLLELLMEVVENDDEDDQYLLTKNRSKKEKKTNADLDDAKTKDALAELDEDDSSDLSLSDITSGSEFVLSSYASTDSESEECSSSNEQNKLSKNCYVKLVRLHKCTEEQLKKLCKENNIIKRKWDFGNNPKNGMKRIRISSTSSDNSSTPSSLGNTNDLYTIDKEGNKENLHKETIELNPHDALAEIICQIIRDSSSDSDIFIENESENKKKIRKRKKPRAVNADTSSDDDDDDVNVANSWKNDPLLRSSLITYKQTKKKNDENPGTSKTSFKKKKSKLEISKDQIVITDSDTTIDSNETDSDIELIEHHDIPPSEKKKGRKNIKALISEKQLTEASQVAKAEEQERVHRLEERAKKLKNTQAAATTLVLDADDSGQPLVQVHPKLYERMKLHQRLGVQFMWEACYERVEIIKPNTGSGCILAHCMGLGKTFQIIVLIHTLFTHEVTKTKKVLIICPLSTVLNWKNEFKIVADLLITTLNFNVYYIVKEDFERKTQIIKNWYTKNGVLVLGYEAYETLIRTKNFKNIPTHVSEILSKALQNEGPDLIICDEGHLLKNGKTLRTKAIMEIRTKRRIILTGTPIQNNLKEYYHMVQFVKPNLMGTYKEYHNLFVNPIMNGQYDNSTQFDVKLMKKRTHVLNKLLKKTVQRFESSELQQYLPPIQDYAVFIALHPLQIQIYKKFINEYIKPEARNIIKNFPIIQLICTHPYTLYIKEKQNEIQKKKKIKEQDTITLVPNPDDNQQISDEWWKELCPSDIVSNIDYGPKLRVMKYIIEECEEIGDKVLIFSSSLIDLNCIEYFLKTIGTKNCQKWLPGRDYQRMDGTVSPEIRTQLCAKFNDSKNQRLRVFLVSHKVGGLGLNLTAANRVILMGTNFNPCYDTQSIYRLYRFGQTKDCYVYRLLTLGTMEEKIYQRSVVKLAVATQVVDKQHVDRHYSSHTLQEMYRTEFESLPPRSTPLLPKDLVLAKLLQKNEDIFKYHDHKALLENRPNEELDEAEKQSAWDEFNNAQTENLTPLSPANPLLKITPVQKQKLLEVLMQMSNYQQEVSVNNGSTLANDNDVQIVNSTTTTSNNINNLHPAVNNRQQSEKEFNYTLNKFV